MKFAIIFDTEAEFDAFRRGQQPGAAAPAPAPAVSAAPALAAAPAPAPLSPAPSAAGAPAPVAAPAPAPAPAPVAAPSAAPSDPNEPTLQNVIARVTAFVKTPGKGGAAKVKEILATTYGAHVTKAQEIPAEHYGHALQTFQYYIDN